MRSAAVWSLVLASACTARTHLPAESREPTDGGDTSTSGDPVPALLEILVPTDDEAVGAYTVFSGRCIDGLTVSMSYSAGMTGLASVDCTAEAFSGAVSVSGSAGPRTITAEQIGAGGIHTDTVSVTHGTVGFNSTVAAD